MVTDDARLTTAQSCQLETWMHHSSGDGAGNEFWALPACNFSGNLEITAGGSYSAVNDRFNNQQLQIKTLFRALTTNDWGAGVALGVTHHPGDRLGIGDPYAYVPVSISFADDRFFLHMNLGVNDEREAHRTPMTWGLGSETQLMPRLQLIAEMYGDTARENKDKPFYQLGLRFSIIQDLLQVDTTYGNQWNQAGDGHWISVGLRITPVAFMH